MLGDVTVRVDLETKMASVLDVFTLVMGNNDTGKKHWVRMKLLSNENPVGIGGNPADEVIVKKINGCGHETPVAPFKTLLELIYLLPGKRAQEVRKSSALYMSRLLAGDLALIDEIEARYLNSTPEEREFFLEGIEESPERTQKRTALEAELEDALGAERDLRKRYEVMVDAQSRMLVTQAQMLEDQQETIKILKEKVKAATPSSDCTTVRARSLRILKTHPSYKPFLLALIQGIDGCQDMTIPDGSFVAGAALTEKYKIWAAVHLVEPHAQRCQLSVLVKPYLVACFKRVGGRICRGFVWRGPSLRSGLFDN